MICVSQSKLPKGTQNGIDILAGQAVFFKDMDQISQNIVLFQ